MTGLFLEQAFQKAYVTTDLDHAVGLFRARYGVEKHLRTGPMTIPLIDGRKMTVDIALAWVGAVQLEIIQPLADDVALYRALLPKAGFGLRFHHLGVAIRSATEWETLNGEIRERGHAVVLSLDVPNTRACYIDTLEELGHYIEYVFFKDPHDPILSAIPQNA